MLALKNQAIQTALLGDWDTAIILNQELLKENPEDIETLNRLAFAYIILGKTKDAKTTYQKVLRLDNQNPIALKNLKRLSLVDKKNAVSLSSRTVDSMFLEENGKTKIIDLINIAEPKVISRLCTGELLLLRVKRLKIFVLDEKTKYIGMLPDNIGKRLIKFLKGGNQYRACVKAADNHKVAIFIKETKRVSRFKNQPSFISSEKSQFLLEKSSPHTVSKHKQTEEDTDDNSYSSADESL